MWQREQRNLWYSKGILFPPASYIEVNTASYIEVNTETKFAYINFDLHCFFEHILENTNGVSSSATMVCGPGGIQPRKLCVGAKLAAKEDHDT